MAVGAPDPRAERHLACEAVPGQGRMLRYEDDAPAEPPLPGDILAREPTTAWSGLTIADMTPWPDIYLWLAGFTPGFCRLDQADDPHLTGAALS